jgi:hypothetical protein
MGSESSSAVDTIFVVFAFVDVGIVCVSGVVSV